MKKAYIIFLSVAFVLFGCDQKNKQYSNHHQIKVVEAKGYKVPADSMGKPKIILAGKPNVVKVGTPEIVPTNSNMHPVGLPKMVVAGMPHMCTPGQDTFNLPKTITAMDSPFVAGIPEVVMAKDAYIKDQNSQNFSTFNKNQGLKHGNVNSLLQDKAGNIWFGTYGGGVSKYDGKFFTNFTEKEWLSNNMVLSMLEDKAGNIWFGTYGGGISKYDGKSFFNFTEKEGLLNSFIMSMLEDESGNIWFGTLGGAYQNMMENL